MWVLHVRSTSTDIVNSYWRCVEKADHSHPLTVEYGSDIDTTVAPAASGSGASGSKSAFPSSGVYARSSWNLNNLPSESGSLLSHLDLHHISGVSVPWMYVGMLFSSFCFHVEDHFMYSINYLHQGAPKQCQQSANTDQRGSIGRQTDRTHGCDRR